MNIRVKLMGLLKEQMPPEGRLSLTDAATIGDALVALQIPRESVQVFSVNGALVRDPLHTLLEGDELTVLPPVGGG